MERAELIDTIIASRIDKYQQKYQGLQLLKNENCRYLIAKNSQQEGFFLIWDGPNKNVNFTKEVYQEVVQEAQKHNLKTPYHVYARLYLCQVDTVNFYQIPNSVLLDFELFEFQEKAALKIVEKYENYLRQPIIIKKGEEETPVPFIQILDALTGSGKTVILAKTIGEIIKSVSRPPIIL
ncbi:3813_t:CDS:2 [Ambispora leptoticha]|uniref:3813_t:CDS:1 n=1 Tax=Ambispora leptoticha TaxID=144679 RepID=A0A9N9H4Y1_9GLOM|nr:3813_t:CDS:2 [Ambispora leptoticha]